MENRKIIFTTHALDRIEEAGLSVPEAKDFIKYATKEKRNGRLKKHKDEKYGKNGNDQAAHYSFGMHLFTILKTQDRIGEKIALVITYTYKPNNNWFYRRK